MPLLQLAHYAFPPLLKRCSCMPARPLSPTAAAKMGCKASALQRALWGDFAYQPKTKRIVRIKARGPRQLAPQGVIEQLACRVPPTTVALLRTCGPARMPNRHLHCACHALPCLIAERPAGARQASVCAAGAGAHLEGGRAGWAAGQWLCALLSGCVAVQQARAADVVCTINRCISAPCSNTLLSTLLCILSTQPVAFSSSCLTGVQRMRAWRRPCCHPGPHGAGAACQPTAFLCCVLAGTGPWSPCS